MFTAHDLQEPPAPPREPAWREFARAPLVPVALAATAGLVADRYGGASAEAGWAVGLVGLVVWLVARSRGAASAVAWLLSPGGGVAAGHHPRHPTSLDADQL